MRKKQIQIVSRSFRCSKRLSQQIDQLAESSDRQASEVIRDALRKYINIDERANFKRGIKQ